MEIKFVASVATITSDPAASRALLTRAPRGHADGDDHRTVRRSRGAALAVWPRPRPRRRARQAGVAVGHPTAASLYRIRARGQRCRPGRDRGAPLHPPHRATRREARTLGTDRRPELSPEHVIIGLSYTSGCMSGEPSDHLPRRVGDGDLAAR